MNHQINPMYVGAVLLTIYVPLMLWATISGRSRRAKLEDNAERRSQLKLKPNPTARDMDDFIAENRALYPEGRARVSAHVEVLLGIIRQLVRERDAACGVTAEYIFDHIKHGDYDHQNWLLSRLRDIVPPATKPVPTHIEK